MTSSRIGINNRHRTALVALVVALWAGGCEQISGGVDIGGQQLHDVGGSGTPADGSSGATDAPAPPDDTSVAPRDTWVAPRDVPPPPDTLHLLAPSCPAMTGSWQVYFSRPVDTTAAPGDPVACAGVRLDNTLAWWIGRAQRSVDIAVYNLDAKFVSDALKAAHVRPGVTVRLIIDGDNGPLDPESRAAELEAAGVPVRDDGTDDRYMHHKFTVIDGERVWMGSVNATSYDGAGSANNAILIENTALAAAYTAEFQRLWDGEFHHKKGGCQSLVLDGHDAELCFSPSTGDAVEHALLDVIRGAREEIFACLFAITKDELAEGLRDRCITGGADFALRMVLDGEHIDAGTQGTLRGCPSAQVLNDAVGAAFGMTFPLFLHHKYMVVDARDTGGDPVVVTGSMNWSYSGVERNDEGTLIWHHPAVARLFAQEFAARLDEAGGSIP